MPPRARRWRPVRAASAVPTLPPCPASYNSRRMVIALDLGTSSARASLYDDIQAVGVTSFWHGLVGFDAAHRPVTPVFMWAESRSSREATLLHDALDEASLHARTGCHLHASYWPAKLR